MSRLISKEKIEALRSRIDIVSVISQYVDLKRSGKSLKGRCPFHADANPSFSVSPEKQLFHCFGCGAKGSVFDFLMQAENIGFPEAYQRLAEGQQPMSQKVDRVFHRFSQPVNVALEKWVDGAHARFLKSSRAQEELRSRGIGMETAKRALLGWLDSGKGIVGPEGEYRDYYEAPWIGFPYVYGDRIRLIKWRVAFSVGKKFARPAGMADCLYTDNLPPDALEEIYLCEGEVDALTLRQVSVRACSLPSGAQSRLSKEGRDYLLGFRLIYLCLDNDEEGKACLRRLLMELPTNRTRIVMLPDPLKDVNELLVKKHKREVEDFRKEFQSLSVAADHPSSLFFSDLDKAFRAYIAKLSSKSSTTVWFQFPWRAVDRMAIVAPGQVISIISSRSGMGKSSFALQVVLHNALFLQRRVGYYSAEMDVVEELVPMITAQITQRDRNSLEPSDVERARQRCAGVEFYFGYDPDAKSWDEHAALLEMAVGRLGIDILVIDHLDFIIRDADWSRANAQKSLATKWLKGVARKYGVLVIVLKQSVKQDPKGRARGDRPADVYDTAGPATTVDDADHAFVLHRNKRFNPTEEDGQDILETKTRVILGKSRKRGPGSAIVSLVFNGHHASFAPLMAEQEAVAGE